MLGSELGGRGDDLVWRRRLLELGVTLRHDLQLTRVSLEEEGRRAAVFVHELTGEEVRICSDHVVVELGMQPVCDLFDELRPQSVNDGELDLERFVAGLPQPWPAAAQDKRFELYRIGDANASRDIHASILEALRLCRVL